jgi:MFS family permease
MSLADADRSGYRDLLGIRSFRLIWLGQSASRLGDAMYVVGLAYLLLGDGQAGAGAATYAGLLACFGFAALGALLPGGVIADVLPRRATLIAMDMVRCVAVIGLALTAGVAGGLEQYLFAALLGVGAGTFGPTYAAIIPDVVPREHLRVAASLHGVSVQLLRIIGPLVASGLVVAVGPHVTLVLNSVTFGLAALATVVAKVPRHERTRRSVLGLRVLTEGLREAVRVRWLGVMLLQGVIQSVLVFGLLQVITPILLGLQGQSALYGPLLACQAVGSLIAAGSARWYRPHRPGLMVNLCLLLVAAEPLLLLSGEVVLLCLAFAAKGFALGTYSVHFYVAIQRSVAPEVRARVSALNQLSDSAGRPIANLGALPAVGLLGAPVLLIGCAIVAAVTAAVVLLVREVQTLGPATPDRAAPAGESAAPIRKKLRCSAGERTE